MYARYRSHVVQDEAGMGGIVGPRILLTTPTNAANKIFQRRFSMIPVPADGYKWEFTHEVVFDVERDVWIVTIRGKLVAIVYTEDD